MFIRIGDSVVNTRYIVSVRHDSLRSSSSVTVTLTNGEYIALDEEGEERLKEALLNLHS